MSNNAAIRAAQLAAQRAGAKAAYASAPRPEQQQESFSDFTASQLYCPTCKRAMPVRQRMLLVLSKGDLFDFLCTGCGNSLGTRQDSQK